MTKVTKVFTDELDLEEEDESSSGLESSSLSGETIETLAQNLVDLKTRQLEHQERIVNRAADLATRFLELLAEDWRRTQNLRAQESKRNHEYNQQQALRNPPQRESDKNLSSVPAPPLATKSRKTPRKTKTGG